MKLMTTNGDGLSREASAPRLLIAVVFLSLLTTYPSYPARAQDTTGGEMGSIDDYVHRQSPRASYSIPELGAEVLDGTGQLEGASIHGAVVVRVYPNGSAAQAGLMSEKHGAQSVLLGAFIMGSFFFPPALLGTVIVSQSQIGESHDTIIGVDSERVEDVQQLENAIATARAGEIIYLTVIRGNARRQVRLSYGNTAQEN